MLQHFFANSQDLLFFLNSNFINHLLSHLTLQGLFNSDDLGYTDQIIDNITINISEKPKRIQSYIKANLFIVGFILCIASSILIQNKIINLEKEINPLLKGSVYDVKFSKKWLDSCDEAIKLGIYKSAFKAYTTVTNTCLILWVICIIGYGLWDFGVVPMVMVTIIWLVQTISYCIESIKSSKVK